MSNHVKLCPDVQTATTLNFSIFPKRQKTTKNKHKIAYKKMLNGPKNVKITASKIVFINENKNSNLIKHACQNTAAVSTSSSGKNDLSYQIITS